MDRAHDSFSASFVGIGVKGQEIGQCLNIEFNNLIKHFQKYREDDPGEFWGNEIPQLTVISPNDSPHESVKKLPEQEVIFLLGSQNDQVLWEVRDKIIGLKKHYLLFTLVLSSKEVFNSDIQVNKKESLIYFDDGYEEQVVTFVKDMCRFGMFPHMVSCDMSYVRDLLSNNHTKLIIFESPYDNHIEPFKQFIADKNDLLKKVTNLFLLISTCTDSFSLHQLNAIVSTIQNAIGDDSNFCFSDSFYATTKDVIRVDILFVQ